MRRVGVCGTKYRERRTNSSGLNTYNGKPYSNLLRSNVSHLCDTLLQASGTRCCWNQLSKLKKWMDQSAQPTNLVQMCVQHCYLDKIGLIALSIGTVMVFCRMWRCALWGSPHHWLVHPHVDSWFQQERGQTDLQRQTEMLTHKSRMVSWGYIYSGSIYQHKCVPNYIDCRFLDIGGVVFNITLILHRSKCLFLLCLKACEEKPIPQGEQVNVSIKTALLSQFENQFVVLNSIPLPVISDGWL